jgi:hypothetical protein
VRHDATSAYLFGAQNAFFDGLSKFRDDAAGVLEVDEPELLDAYVRGYLAATMEQLTQHNRTARGAACEALPGHRAPLRPAGEPRDG